MLKEVKKRGIKVITNAGGVNLEACVEALKKTAEEQGVELSVAMVAGDDMMDKVIFNAASSMYTYIIFISLLPQVDAVRSLGVRDLDTDRGLPDKVLSMNAYLG